VVLFFPWGIFYKVFRMLLSWSILQIPHERASSIPPGFVCCCQHANQPHCVLKFVGIPVEHVRLMSTKFKDVHRVLVCAGTRW
jgi:hypothetical protein